MASEPQPGFQPRSTMRAAPMPISSTLPTWKEPWWKPGAVDVRRASAWWSVPQRMKAMMFRERSESFMPSTRV